MIPRKLLQVGLGARSSSKLCGISKVANMKSDCLVDKGGSLNLSELPLQVKYMCVTQYTLNSIYMPCAAILVLVTYVKLLILLIS